MASEGEQRRALGVRSCGGPQRSRVTVRNPLEKRLALQELTCHVWGLDLPMIKARLRP
jgi:hypothetical protein